MTQHPMKSVGRLASSFVVILLAASWGCAGRTAYQRGIEAEQRGEAHLAFAYYAKAAQSSPSNGSYVRAIRRLGPEAADQWLSLARTAEADRRYGDAWKAAMRCLLVQPDHSAALAFIDALEGRHGAMIAGVRRAWMQSGAASLAIDADARTADARNEVRTGSPTTFGAGDAGGAAPQPPGGFPKSGVRRLHVGRTQVARPRDADAASNHDGRVVHWLGGDRSAREIETVGGVRIRLRDVNRDGVDLDLFDGRRRIQKIRELRAGESKLMLSPAGAWYRLTVLELDQDADRVRIELSRA